MYTNQIVQRDQAEVLSHLSLQLKDLQTIAKQVWKAFIHGVLSIL